MTILCDNLKMKDVKSILDTLSSIQPHQKLCFSANQIAIEGDSSILRTASSWASYAIGSPWNREISNLKTIMDKIIPILDVSNVDEIEKHDDLVILSDKVRGAIYGLNNLWCEYQENTKQADIVQNAKKGLEDISLNMEKKKSLYDERIKKMIEENKTLNDKVLKQEKVIEILKNKLNFSIEMVAKSMKNVQKMIINERFIEMDSLIEKNDNIQIKKNLNKFLNNVDGITQTK